jgi:hypothetical protein
MGDMPAPPSPQEQPKIDRDTLIQALDSLSSQLQREGVTGELCLYGGAVMVLAFQARQSTRDVDAIFQPASAVRHAARLVADELNLEEHWLNDGVKGFISQREQVTSGDLPQFPALRVVMATPEYLLAMKCMAARVAVTANEPSDVADILFLIRHLGIQTPDAVLELVEDYYPRERIPVRTQYLVESLFEEALGERAS